MNSIALPALRSSVDRLALLTRPLNDDAIGRPAYPTEWTIADVISHIGSGAVIWKSRVGAAIAGLSPDPGFDRSVWSDWDAKTPRAKVDDGLRANAELVRYLDSVSSEDRASVKVPMSSLTLDWSSCVRMRLADHLLHEWDVAVCLDAGATLADDGTAVVIDNLEMIAGYAGKPTGQQATVSVATTTPERSFIITVADAVALTPSEPTTNAMLSMPAEAFIRLVYGRLDFEDTPASFQGDHDMLDLLRRVFTGF